MQRRQHGLVALIGALLIGACNSKPAADAGSPSGSAAAEPVGKDGPTASEATLGLYPGSKSTGQPDQFESSDSIDNVVQWYRDDSARRREMMFVSTERNEGGYLIIGTAGEEGQSFALQLTARSGGGTETRVLPYDPKGGLKQ